MNYTELTQAAIQYADRHDIEVAESMDVFIKMAEARINRVLRTREQSHRSFTPTFDDQEYYPLPTDFNGLRDIQLNTANPSQDHETHTMQYLTPEQMNSMSKSGSGVYYTIVANQLQVRPVQKSGKTFEIVYYRKVPNLTETDDTNWLSESHPDIYMSGIIAEIQLFAKNYDVSTLWDERMSRSIGELDNSDDKERWGNPPLTMRVE